MQDTASGDDGVAQVSNTVGQAEAPPPRNSYALVGGIICSTLWLAAYAYMAYHADRCVGAGPIQNTLSAWWASHVSCLTLNAIGDSMAGLAGPLGFIWFLTAVLLQKKELEYTRHEFEQTRKVAQDQLEQFEKQVQLMDAANTTALRNTKLSYRVGLLDQWIEVSETADRVLAHILSDPDEFPPPMRSELVRAARLASLLHDKEIAEWLYQLLDKGEAYFMAKAKERSAYGQLDMRQDYDLVSGLPNDVRRASIEKENAWQELTLLIDEKFLNHIGARHLSEPE